MKIGGLDVQLTPLIKYVFFDVIGFTKKGLMEQRAIALALPEIVKVAEKFLKMPTSPGRVRHLPTGDGMCVCIHAQDLPADIHLQLARAILSEVERHNNSGKPWIALHLAIGEGNDFVEPDINDMPNFYGNGINHTARAMKSGGEGEIVLTESAKKSLEPLHGAFIETSLSFFKICE